jgi:TPR repeat protein
MVACFAMAEFISLFERKHNEAAGLYKNVCFRPKTDKSPNSVLVDGTKAYPAGCFNLAKMTMTGKGMVQYDNAEAYRLFDRACRGGHGGACYFQAQILCTRPGSLGPDVPHDPRKATQLYQQTCDAGDSNACFTLATMLLRGERVSKTTDNVSPQEALGLVPLVVRKNEPDRHSTDKDKVYIIPRDPPRAEKLMLEACNTGSHVTACHNLVVMYTQGDDGVPIDQEKAGHYAKRTQEMMKLFGHGGF